MTQPNTEKYFPIYFSLHYQISKNNSLFQKKISKMKPQRNLSLSSGVVLKLNY